MKQYVPLRLLSILLIVSVLSGCSTTVEFISDIEGASVTALTGENYGVTPVSVSYDNDQLDDSRDLDGCARITGVTYRWPSGATASSDNPIVLCGSKGQYTVRLNRPEDAPGAEIDLKNALLRMRARQKELEIELERERLYSDHFFMMGPFFGPMMMPPPRPPMR